MLSHILIRDFTIIEHLELELNCGMTALTGETGAGKSILIDAISLVLGDRADSSVIRAGAEKAEIIATFELKQQATALAWIRQHDFDDDEGCCTIRRIVTKEGRTRAYIGGSPVTLQVLKELGEQLVDIHGQHAHQSLLKRPNQLKLLDLQADHEPLLGKLLSTYQEWAVLQAARETADHDADHRQKKLELLDFQCRELEAASPRRDEIAELEEEHLRLSHASQLLGTVQMAYSLLYEGDPDTNSMLSRVVDALDSATELDPRLNPSLELLRNAQIEIQESAIELRRYEEDLSLDPSRLDEIGSRLALLQSLARKHRCDTEALSEKLAELQVEREALIDYDNQLARLDTDLESVKGRYDELAALITKGRQQAAKTLGTKVSEDMQMLGMSGGRFVISHQTRVLEKPSPHGTDLIEFQVSANPGQPLQPLTKVVSGGELSRISLALQLAATLDRRLPTLIFDEVDSGVGGGVAEIVGRMLRQLGVDRQVLCVTHLPQVAAQAHQQLAVRKTKGDNSTQTHVEALLGKQARVQELARMLGGMHITPQSQAHAEEMLREAQLD